MTGTVAGAILLEIFLTANLPIVGIVVVGLALGYGLGFETATVARVFVLETAMATSHPRENCSPTVIATAAAGGMVRLSSKT